MARRRIPSPRPAEAARAAGVDVPGQHDSGRRSRDSVLAGTATDEPSAPAEDDGLRSSSQRVGGARSRAKPGDPYRWNISSGSPMAACTPTPRSSAWRKSCRSKARRPIATTRRTIRASRSPTACTIGIRRFRSTSSACARAMKQYWKQYRTTPKAFIPLARGQQLWGTRFGKLTSIRISPPAARFAAAAYAELAARFDPAENGPYGLRR